MVILPSAAWAHEPDEADAGDPSATSSERTAPIRVRVRKNEPSHPPAAPDRWINGEVLEHSPRGTLLEAVAQETPGLYVNARGPIHGLAFGASGGMRLRGLGGSPNTQMVVLEDGVPDMMGLFGHPIPDAYLPAYLDGVQVIPGGDSVSYGNGALAGVVDIRTRWVHQPEVRLNSQYGAFNTISLQPGYAGSCGRLDWVLTGRFLSSDGHRDFAGGNNLNLFGKARMRLGDHWSLRLRQRTFSLRAFDPGTVQRPFHNHEITALRFNQSVGLDHTQGRWSGRHTLWFNTGHHQIHDGFRSRDESGGLWLSETFQAAPWADLSFGMDARLSGGLARNIVTGASWPAWHDMLVDPYQELLFKPAAWLRINGGLRQHFTTRGNFNLFGKAGAEADLPAGFRVAARMSQGYREPTIVEQRLPLPAANPDLRPERSTVVEGVLGFAAGKTLMLEAVVYHMAAADYIRITGAFPAFERVNLRDLSLNGVEGRGRWRIHGPLSASVTGAWNETGIYTAQTPGQSITGSLNWESPVWRATISGFWYGALYQRDYSEDPIPSPWSLDARADWMPFGGQINLFLIARNLFNRQYAFVQNYLMPGFHLMGGLELHWHAG
ncbi:MAG: Vitamin B12 transporter BtuB [Myxococcota bacterium]|nr:Vitamin B12 transporter BtuB [Myxococcota bacterium]